MFILSIVDWISIAINRITQRPAVVLLIILDRFFLMHLINKPDTEYTGQETYVWNMYQQRCWDFFPVGDCFRKQYEVELGGGESEKK